jgi:hypothetical protein
MNPYTPPGAPRPYGPPHYGHAGAYGWQAPAPWPYAGTHYEFGPAENAVIGSAGTWARFLGIMRFVEAGLALLNINLIAAGIAVAVGLGFFHAGRSLDAVVKTEGHDVPHLMTAIEHLGGALRTRTVVTAVAAALALLLGVLFVIVLVLTAYR